MNSFGDNFRIAIFGESHAPATGIVLDGVPAGIELSQNDFTADILRRKSGSLGTTPRIEDDIPEILSGVADGCTTGAPLTIIFRNNNIKSQDYSSFREVPRPGHADFVASIKYNFHNDIRGGGHFSGRLTLPLVAAGVVAKKVIDPISISARLIQAGGINLDCPPMEDSRFVALLKNTIGEGDSLGGVVECRCTNVPIALGEPFFNSVESMISHAMFSIPGVRGVEFGDGFAAAAMKGSQHNDCYIDNEGRCATNGAGGVNGGLTNGNEVFFRVAFKPTSSIAKVQRSYNFISEQVEEISIPGRHDACFALRTPVVVEAMAAVVFANFIK